MTSRITCFGVSVALIAVAWAGTPETAVAQTLTRKMVESHVKDWVAAASANKPEAIVRLDPAANGFGYRQLKARSADVPVPAQLDTVKAFLASVESYRVTLDEVQTEVEGDVGLAWGFYTEEFRHNGRNPEKVRVRFTFTFKYERGDWRTLLYHRDIQKFDEKGAYLPGQ